jgi:hypothetical protein
MADMLHIKNGTFDAEIILDELPRLTLPNIRKLFRLMLEDPWENRDTIDSLSDTLEEKIKTAKTEATYKKWVKIKSIFEGEKNL